MSTNFVVLGVSLSLFKFILRLHKHASFHRLHDKVGYSSGRHAGQLRPWYLPYSSDDSHHNTYTFKFERCFSINYPNNGLKANLLQWKKCWHWNSISLSPKLSNEESSIDEQLSREQSFCDEISKDTHYLKLETRQQIVNLISSWFIDFHDESRYSDVGGHGYNLSVVFIHGMEFSRSRLKLTRSDSCVITRDYIHTNDGASGNSLGGCLSVNVNGHFLKLELMWFESDCMDRIGIGSDQIGFDWSWAPRIFRQFF